ncbi:MAG: hypothetical protein HZA61_02845 [Candidatus Eisenbacteria bacterium]|uniref:C2H2-type domain-containing protein n=1 Tax=Eiseniibacteriota bacterium TaxID=2212470 RepID=A0A933W222_UNCEI|nr:hypothetical protein [Candidatus Eisenbacteria bacterium]
MFAKDTSIRSAGAAALVAALLCLASAGVVSTTHAQGAEGRDYRRGDRPENGERAREPRTAPAPSPSGGDGGHVRRGDAGRDRGGWSGGDRGGRGDRGERRYRGGDRSHDRDRGGYGGGYREYRGPRHGGGYYGDGWRHRDYPRRTYWRSRPVVRLHVGWGYPFYCSPRYRYRVMHRPLVRTYVPEIQVDNYPPAGCYYWDPYCERSFENLDDYTEHLDGADHDEIVEIVDEDTGDYVRTLEMSGGYWSVRR